MSPGTLEETISRALSYLNASQTAVSLDAAVEDQKEEVESLVNGFEVDKELEEGTLQNRNAKGLDDLLNDKPTSHLPMDSDQLTANLKHASKGVVVDTTLSDYANYWNQFKDFTVTIGKVKSPEEVDALFPNIPMDFPTWIALWIMHKCDEINIWTGKAKLPNDPRSTYGTAQKMRAAISHKFGRDYGLGTQQWMEHPTIPGKFIGNPSLSVVVSQFMVSLRRCKVRSGEAVTSARAMDMATMKQLFDFANTTIPKEYGPISRKHKAENPSEWAGQHIRMMLYLLYLVSLLCLLRFDEALRITWADVVFQIKDLSVDGHWENATPENLLQEVKLRPEHFCIQLNLPFRKTHQYGGIAPFYLYADCHRPWMCPLRAFAIWWIMAWQQNEQLDGFVFRKRVGSDGVSINPTEGMTSAAFLECFRNNLLDIGVDPRPYGTHSFRRGGCQYLHTVLKWPFRQICAWGGWAENLDNPSTIFKYLLSWNDNPDHEREELMNPNRPGTDPCSACGRTCHCA